MAGTTPRSPIDILAERRENALELHRETCPIARGLLEFHIGALDRELAAGEPSL